MISFSCAQGRRLFRRNNSERVAANVRQRSQRLARIELLKKGRCSMKWSNHYRMRLVVVGVVTAFVLGGHQSAIADIAIGEGTCVDEVINRGTNVQGCSFLHDGLKLYFTNNLSGSTGIWVTSREAQDAPWGEPVDLGPNVNSGGESYPAISPDELELYFHPSYNSKVLMRSTRASKDEPWGPATTYTDLGDARYLDFAPDGLTVYFSSNRPGGYGGVDIWTATRTTVDAPWSEPLNLGPNINASGGQYGPSISNDGLVFFFYTGNRIYMARRATKDDTWGPAVKLGPSVNDHGWVIEPEISPDGSVLYFDSNANRPGGFAGENFWQVSIIPIVDLNGDGIVDVKDVVILTEHWGEDYPLCDIGPTPFGDGIVDVQDLLVLADHLEPEAREPVLIAYWRLDETQGNTALDTISGEDASVFGGALWQPESGAVDGALQLDGIDDWVFTSNIQNLGLGPISILAWIKGGAPNQVVMSQPMISNCFAVNGEDRLTTELGESVASLVSEAVITDGDWHRIGVVLDGSQRSLYVDGVRVGEDSLTGSGVTASGLNIGVGKDYLAGTYFSGLIDDVRIYDMALSTEEIAALPK